METFEFASNDPLAQQIEIINENINWARKRINKLDSSDFRDDCISISEEFKEILAPEVFHPSGWVETLVFPYSGEMRDEFESDSYGS